MHSPAIDELISTGKAVEKMRDELCRYKAGYGELLGLLAAYERRFGPLDHASLDRDLWAAVNTLGRRNYLSYGMDSVHLNVYVNLPGTTIRKPLEEFDDAEVIGTARKHEEQMRSEGRE